MHFFSFLFSFFFFFLIDFGVIALIHLFVCTYVYERKNTVYSTHHTSSHEHYTECYGMMYDRRLPSTGENGPFTLRAGVCRQTT